MSTLTAAIQIRREAGKFWVQPLSPLVDPHYLLAPSRSRNPSFDSPIVPAAPLSSSQV